MAPRDGFTHEAPVRGKSNIWLTPLHLLKMLGPFDLDPCAAPDPRPWPTAAAHFDITKGEDGLKLPWWGSVFCNPPYGPETGAWLRRCAEHGDAVALVFTRTETRAFFDEVWDKADAVLFLRGRLKFWTPAGVEGESAAAPSVLVAYGSRAYLRLPKAAGHFVELRP